MAISFLASQSIDGTLGVSGLATLSFAVESPKLYKANANLNIVGGGSQIDFTRCQIQLINNGGLKISVPDSTTLTMSGKVLFDTILNAGIDTDKFLVSSSGVLSFRTGAEVRSDIGAGTGSVTGSGTAETVAKWSTGGTGIEDGPITFSSDDSIFAGKASFDTTQAPAAKIQAGAKTFDGSNGVYTDSRLGIMNNGSLTSIVNASTYDDATYPDYGLVFIQGPSTSSYNVWSLSPDGPTKGSDLNFIYQAQATNIHTQTPMLVLKGSDSSASFAGAVDVAGSITGTTGSFTGLVSGITPTAAANFATKQYVDDNAGGGGTVTGTGSSGRVTFWKDTSEVASNSAFTWDNANKYLGISHWTTATATPAVLLHLFGKDNDIDVPQIRIEGRENPGDTRLDIAVKDADGRFNLVENTGDASNGYGLMTFKSNANSVAASPNRGGFLFQLGAGTIIDALSIANTGNASFSKAVEVAGTISADGGIDGLTNGNGGISGSNYNISGVNQLSINDPGEGIVFNGTATLTLAVIDDLADDKLKLTNATQLDLSSTARITNLVDPTGNQDAATKIYVDSKVSGAVRYIGTWSAAANGSTTGGTPDLTDTTLHVPGNYYICEVAGTAEPNGTGTEPDTWAVGDWVIFSDLVTDAWQKIDNSTVLSGAGVANQVSFWSDTETISGGTGFTYAGGATGAVAIGGTLASGALTVTGALSVSTSAGITGALTIGTVANATTDPDKFLCVSSSGNVQYRTGTEVRSDIGAGTGTVTGTGAAFRVATWNGNSSLTSDTDLTFDGSNLTVGGLVLNKIYKTTSADISNSYVRIIEVDETGSQLSSACRVTMTAHGNSHVTTATANIYVGHFQDILIESINLNYTQVTLKVESNSNGQWTLSVKSSSSNSASYKFDIEGLSNNLSITLLPMASQTGTTLEHTTNFGTNITSIDGSTSGSSQSRFGSKVHLDSIDTNTSSTTALVLDGSEVEKRTLGTGAFATIGDYLPLTGGALSGNVTFNGAETTFNPDSDSQVKILNAGTDAVAIFAAAGDALYLGGNNTTGMYLDASANAHFAGTIDVGTLTLSGSAIVADVGMTIQVDGGTTNSITLDNAGTVTFGYYTYFPNYLFHEGDTDTFVQFGTGTVKLRGDSGITLDGNVSVDGTTISSGFVTGKVGFGINYVGGATVPMVILANATDYGIFYREASPDHIEFKHGGTVRQSFDGNGNVSFTGGLTATTGTFSGNVTVSGTSSTFNTGNSGTFVTNDASNYARLTMTSASAQLGLFRKDNGGMYIGGSADGFRIFTTSFSQKLLVSQTGDATFAGLVDATNYKINGGQGSDGQVLTSTGSGVAWETPSGGGSSGIGGSGTAGFIPRFSAGTTLGNTNIQNDGTNTTINTNNAIFQVTKPGNAEPSFYVDTSQNTGKVGIRTNTPASALDCYGNANFRNILNVGGTNQYLFVGDSTTNPVGYVRMGYYGQGADYDASGGAQSSVQYTSGFSNGGKVCEDERIMTFKLTRTQMANLTGTGQKTLISQDSNFNYIVKEAYLYQVNTSGGQAPNFGGTISLQYQCSHGGTTSVSNAFSIYSSVANQTRNKRKVLIFDPTNSGVQTGIADAVPRAAVVLVSSGGVSSAGSGTVDYFLRMRVKNIDFNDDIKNNAQLITVT